MSFILLYLLNSMILELFNDYNAQKHKLATAWLQQSDPSAEKKL